MTPATRAAPACAPPTEVAVAHRADDYESSRLLIVNVGTHEVVWRGPTGSGNRRATWSRDGSMLAYTLGEDLIVHRDTGPDRLIYRGLDTEHPLYAFSPDDRLVAVVGADGVGVVDLGGSGTLSGSAVDTGIACLPERMMWTRDATRLVVSCGDEQVLVWSSVQRNMTQHEVEGVISILGWLPGHRDMMVANADGGVIATSIDGSKRQVLRTERQDDLIVTGYVEGAGLLEYSDYAPDDAAPRTIWLAQAPPMAAAVPGAPAPIGSTPPLAWIDGTVFDIGYSPDGAWAAFGTAVDSMDESGDIYLARVGDPKVTMVIQAPREANDDDDYDEDYDGDDDDDDDEGDDDEDLVYYVGYATPTPRPVPGSRCRAVSGAAPLLPISRELSDAEEYTLSPGVIIALLESGSYQVMHGDSLSAFERPSVDAALGLGDGSFLLAEPAGVQLIGADGKARATLPALDLETVIASPGGGFLVLRDPRTLELFDANGTRTGVYAAPDEIAEQSAMAGGGAVVTLDGGEVVTVDATGKRRASFQLGAARKVVALSTDVLVHAEPAAEDEDDEDYDEYAEESVNLVFESPTGKTLGHYRAESADADSAMLVPLGNGSVAALTGSERTKLHLLDSRARIKGSFKIGTYTEVPPLVLDDGSIVVRGGYHDLFVIDARGRYLGGISLDEEIYEGPVRMGAHSFAVQTESRVVILRRPTR